MYKLALKLVTLSASLACWQSIWMQVGITAATVSLDTLDVLDCLTSLQFPVDPGHVVKDTSMSIDGYPLLAEAAMSAASCHLC